MLVSTSNGEPRISAKAFVSESAVIMGNVEIGHDVFIAPNATIRADEPGSRVIIHSGCNVQDNVVVHALAGSKAEVFSNSTLGHGCIVHGPCIVGKDCFIGFGSIVFGSEIGDGCVVLHRAVIQDAVVPKARMVGNGQVIEGSKGIDSLSPVPSHMSDFVKGVSQMNRDLVIEHGNMNGAARTMPTSSRADNVNSL